MARLSAFVAELQKKSGYTISVLVERGFERLKTKDDGTVVLKLGASIATISPFGYVTWSTASQPGAAP